MSHATADLSFSSLWCVSLQAAEPGQHSASLPRVVRLPVARVSAALMNQIQAGNLSIGQAGAIDACQPAEIQNHFWLWTAIQAVILNWSSVASPMISF